MWLFAHEDQAELFCDALGRDMRQQPCVAHDRVPEQGFDAKMQRTRETDRAQDAQGVFLQPPRGIAHTADDAGTQVFLPVERIDDAQLWMHGHGIDREVASAQIPEQIRGKGYCGGMPVIAVFLFDPVSGHLDRFSIMDQGHGAMSDPGRYDPAVSGKDRHDLLRQGVSGNVIVMYGTPQQRIPHASADEKSFMRVGVQNRDHIMHWFRQAVEWFHAHII